MKDALMENTHENDIELPITEQGVIDFLASDAVDGIGQAYATRLVEKYGLDVVEILKERPDFIEGIKGLGVQRIEDASKSLREIKHPIDLTLFLFSAGVPHLYIDRIFGKYRRHTRDVILHDPYQMVEDVWRLSFFTADKIGKALGIDPDDPRRLRGALLTAVKHYAEEGHLFATERQAVDYASKIAGVDSRKVEAVIPSLLEDDRLVQSKGGLYLPVYYEAEKNCAKRLLALAEAKVKTPDVVEIPDFDMLGHVYTPKQKEAMLMAIENPVMVLTGGPGSGKTTVLKGILDHFSNAGLSFTLVAPTGRAAKRMSALTGHEATTIHHLLGYRMGEGYYNKSIDTDLLVIDEGSMLEQVLFDHLLEAVGMGTRIIVVGDVDQLPAIGAGDVMRDMIKSGVIPVARLDENFRQKEGSMIAANAMAINHGEMPEAKEEESFIIVDAKGQKAIHEKILSLVSEEIPEKYSISSGNIQVVTPQQMGPLGARQLNVDLQECLNPDGPEIRRGFSIMRLGDPVMQTANSRLRGLFNGEIGRIVEVDPDQKWLVVEFAGGKESVYQRSDLSELTLAYATTVHKLQGSEVDYMVMPMTMSHKPMLYRNLLYTGISRARRLCVLVGEEEAIRFAVSNNRDSVRNSNFHVRLQQSGPESS